MNLVGLRWLAITLLAFVAAAQEQVETKHENGALHERYAVDAAGRKNGRYEEYRADGTLSRRCTFAADHLNGRADAFAEDGKTVVSSGEYRQDKQHGAWTFFSPTTARRRKVEFKDGVLHGSVTVLVNDKVVSRQKWKEGQLEKLDDVVPFPIPASTLREQLARVLAPPAEPIDVSKDPHAAERAAALRRLKAYRALCGLYHDGIVLVPEWNALCDAAAEICRLNGGLSHTPPRPAGVDDALYRQAQEGASHSNLAIGGSLADSIDSYMNDSDDTNIDRIGHRRWCLNPVLNKTGFGVSQDYSAMWSMDQSGKAVRGMEAVLYPPAGWCPVDFFSPARVFSITLLRGAAKTEDLRASVRPLDDDWVPGELLPIEHLAMAQGDFGGTACITFRVAGFDSSRDKRYWVEISTDAGKTTDFRYVVAFCDPASSGK